MVLARAGYDLALQRSLLILSELQPLTASTQPIFDVHVVLTKEIDFTRERIAAIETHLVIERKSPPNARLGPTKLLQRPRVRPDLRHVPNLVALKIHDIDVVGFAHGLARGFAWPAWAGVRASEHAIGADVLALFIRRE